MIVPARFGIQIWEKNYSHWMAIKMWCIPLLSIILLGKEKEEELRTLDEEE